MDNISHYEYITKSNSIWKDIYNNLKDWYKGEVSIYPAGIKTGECIMPYIVVTYGGGSKLSSFSTVCDYYTLMLYVPKQEYSLLEPFIADTKEGMKRLKPKVLPTHEQTSSYYDDEVKAHMVSLTYKNYKKL